MEKEELRRPLKIFGWALVFVALMCWTMHTARYWTDFALAGALLLFWFDVRDKRKKISYDSSGDYYRGKIWKQEQPLCMVTFVCMVILGITQFPFMYNYYTVRNIIRNLVFTAVLICFVWLVVLLIRRDFGKASRTTQREKEAFRQIRDGARRKRAERKKKKEIKNWQKKTKK